jgi:hypothetical protein
MDQFQALHSYCRFCIIIHILIFMACSPKISQTEKELAEIDKTKNLNVKLIYENDTVPANAKFIETIEIGTSMFCANCNTVLSDEVTKAADRAGGNLAQITKTNSPEGANPYESVDARIYWTGRIDSGLIVKSSDRVHHIVLKQPLNSFGEVLGGIGFGCSFEYERKLSGKYSGPAIRVGIGMAGFDISYTSFPIQFNYLIGRDGYYFEIGGGVTCVRNNQTHIKANYSFNYIIVPNDRRMSYYGTAYLGYRGPLKSRNYLGAFRFGLTPYFGYRQVSAYLNLGLEFPF